MCKGSSAAGGEGLFLTTHPPLPRSTSLAREGLFELNPRRRRTFSLRSSLLSFLSAKRSAPFLFDLLSSLFSPRSGLRLFSSIFSLLFSLREAVCTFSLRFSLFSFLSAERSAPLLFDLLSSLFSPRSGLLCGFTNSSEVKI